MLLGADKPLERSVLNAGILVEEERGHDAPAREVVDVVRAALHHHDLGPVVVQIPVDLFGHDQLEDEAQRVGRLDVVVQAAHLYVGGALAGLYGDGVRTQGVVQPFDGVAALVDDLHAERTVVIARDGRGDGNREVFLVLKHHVGRRSVGEHDELPVRIGLVLLLAAGEEGGEESRCK